MSNKLTQDQVIEKFIEVHGTRFDYSKVIYLGIFIKVCIICHKHGEFYQAPHNHLNGDGCPSCKFEKIGNLRRSNKIEFIQKAKEFHNNKYGYDNFIYKNSQTKGYVTCFKHGDFLISPNNHLRGKGCPECNIDRLNNNHHNKLTLEDFIEKARIIHGDNNDYSESNYKNAHKKIKIKCLKNKNHGYYYQKPNNHLQGQGCPKCNYSKGEAALEAIFIKNNIKYEPQFKLPFCNYEYDFHLPEYGILVEFHGRQHYEPVDRFGGLERFKKQLDRDAEKRSLAREYSTPLIEIHYKHLDHKYIQEFEQLFLKELEKRMVIN